MNSAALLNVHVNIRDPLVNVVGEAYMNIFLLRRSPDVDKQSLIRLYQQQNIKTRQKLVNVSIVDATIFIRAKNEMPWHSSTDVLKCVRSRWHRAVKNSEDNCRLRACFREIVKRRKETRCDSQKALMFVKVRDSVSEVFFNQLRHWLQNCSTPIPSLLWHWVTTCK